MAELLLVNPRKRARKSKKSKSKRRSRAYSYRKHSSRRRNPVRRLRRKSVRKYVAHRAIKHRRSRRSYRRNPISLRGYSLSGITGSVMDAGKGALGAIANDALMTYIPMPIVMKTGMIGQLTRAAMAFVLGWGTSIAGGKKLGADLTRGALTVQLYAIAKPLVSHVVPLADADMGYYNPGTVLSDDMGQYLGASSSGTSPWNQNVTGGDDVDAFAGVDDASMGVYIQ